MQDFTIRTYEDLLKSLINQGFLFQAFTDFNGQPGRRAISLRHDIDLLPENSLKFAKIQADKGISGTYYFRTVPESWNEAIIREIAQMGHEVGYHYEDIGATADRRKAESGRRKDFSKKYVVCSKEYEEYERKLTIIAIESFAANLERLRKIAPVKTICMHGSPMSRWDSRLLWKYYDYRDFGIVGEPYFDINFNEVLYLTDTGRRWDSNSVNIRDKAQGSGLRAQGAVRKQVIGDRNRAEGELTTEGSNSVIGSENLFHDWKVKPFKYRDNFTEPATCNPQPATFPTFHSTSDIIKAAEENRLPDQIMMTFHPQRWTDKPLPWVKELVWQNVKNVAKYFIVKVRRE